MQGHPYSVDSAREAAARDELGAWVVEFLGSPGSDNAKLGELLADPPRSWAGPLQIPLDQLHRLAGPPDSPALVPMDEDDWRDDVENMADLVEDGWEPPPVIATYRDGQLLLEDGNHRVESLRRAGERAAWTVVAFESAEERARFTAENDA